jgi:hypothetical protein
VPTGHPRTVGIALIVLAAQSYLQGVIGVMMEPSIS